MTGHEGIARPTDGLDDREAEIYRLTVVNRLPLAVIGERFGISPQRVHQILQKIREKLPPLDIEAIRAASMKLHEDVIRRAYEIAEMNGAPVTAGKDGTLVYDPEKPHGANLVRDYGGKIAALKLALAADAELRKLTGADAAQKVEQTGMLKYIVEGVDLSKLT